MQKVCISQMLLRRRTPGDRDRTDVQPAILLHGFWEPVGSCLGLQSRSGAGDPKSGQALTLLFFSPGEGVFVRGCLGLGKCESINESFLFVFFIPHLETLILVKVFPSWLVVQVDIYGAWWRGREDKPWKFLCCHFAHITLVQKIFGRVWEAAGTDIVTRFHGRGGACVKPGRIIKTIKGSEKTSFGLEISLKNIVEAGKKTVVFLMKAID